MRAAHISSHNRIFRRALLAGAGLVALAQPAFAQDAAQDPAAAPAAQEAEDEIVVSGIRETIQTSINAKRTETAIVDALSSDDIGDLPALSVGTAIQTITGATTHREKGEASEIALRGLGPFLSNATFNGREATNGSGDRSVNFNQFPSELINQIKIYKSQQANLVEGGVAGTIELGTLRPLNVKGRRIQGEIKSNYSPYADKITGDSAWGYRGTLSYVDQFDLGGLGRFGISLGAQRNEGSNPEETMAASSTWTACSTVVVANNNCTPITRAQARAGQQFYLVPNSIAFRQISESDRRDAFFGALQWQPNDTLDINLDLQYSTRKFVERRRDLNISEARVGLTNVVIGENNRVLSLSGLSALESTAADLSRDEEYLGGGASVAWNPTDRLSVTVDASYSRTIRTEIERNARLRTANCNVYGVPNYYATSTNCNSGTSARRVGYTLAYVDGNFAPTITIDPRFNVNDPAQFYQDARLRRDEVRRENEIKAVRLDAGYDVGGFLRTVSAGFRASELTYTDYDVRNEPTLTTPLTLDRTVNEACRQAFPQRDFLSAAEGNSITSWATFDTDCLFQGYAGTTDIGRPADLRSTANRDVTERTLAGYVMAEYQGDIGIPVRGNFGVRVVNTHVTSLGLRSAFNVSTDTATGVVTLTPTGNYDTVRIESETTRFLPSVNTVFDLRSDLVARAAIYRAMSRPAPSNLGAGRDVNAGGTNPTSIDEAVGNIAATGSPRLQPLMSWNGDVALEWYPNKDSILSTTLYYKQFQGGFIPVVYNETFSIGGQDITRPVTQTANSDRKSRIWGLELTAATRFSFLPKPLDGLGAKVSYNYAESDFQTEDELLGDQFNPVTGVVDEGIIPPANITGYSKHVLSAQAYYDIGPLSLQAIYNYRSNYYQSFVSGVQQLRYVDDNNTLDFRASLDLMKNVSLRFEAINIFDEPKVTYMPVQSSTRQYHYYGARYFIGMRVRL